MKSYATARTIGSKAAGWLAKIESYNRHKMRINASASALLVVDMQMFFLDPASPTYTCGGPAALPAIKRLVTAFRAAGRPVIFTQHVHHPSGSDLGIMDWWWEGRCLQGSEASEIHSELGPLSGEKIIIKHRYSAFYNTDLETVLRCLRIEDLVISGIMTNLCCESTARDAYFRDYRVFIPADGTGTITEEMHLASLLNMAFGFAFVTTGDRLIAQVKSR
jgi:nicotinamidase-related amidase